MEDGRVKNVPLAQVYIKSGGNVENFEFMIWLG